MIPWGSIGDPLGVPGLNSCTGLEPQQDFFENPGDPWRPLEGPLGSHVPSPARNSSHSNISSEIIPLSMPIVDLLSATLVPLFEGPTSGPERNVDLVKSTLRIPW